MSKILISGASGHVGKIINEHLIKSNDVLQINRTQNNSNNEILYEVLEKDLVSEIKDKFSELEVFIHVASEIDYNNNNYNLSLFNCAMFHKILSYLASFSNIKKVILISGASIVGNNHKDIINEDTEVKPMSVYHLTKFYQEKLIELYNFESYYNLRINSPISPYLKKKTIFKVFLDNALANKNLIVAGKGGRIQNYIDVRDLAIVIENILNSDFKSGTYNICSPNSISNFELASKIIELTKSTSLIKFEGVDKSEEEQWTYDINKSVSELNFQQNFDIGQTIMDYIEYNQK